MTLERLGKLIAGCFLTLLPLRIRSKVVGFVKNNSNSSAVPQADGQRAGRFRESILAISKWCLANAFGLLIGNITFTSEHLEAEIKNFVQFSVPIVTNPAGTTAEHVLSSPHSKLAKHRAVSMVFPSPTSSAMRNRRGEAVARRCVREEFGVAANQSLLR